jgi:hypothetical protein
MASLLVPWTDAAVGKAAVPDDTPENAIRVEVDSVVTMRVNGTVATTMPRDSAFLDGAAGYRIGRLASMHSRRTDLLHHLAPPRPAPRPGGALR